MNKKYGVLMTALFTVGSTVYAEEPYPDETDFFGMDEYIETMELLGLPADISAAAHVLAPSINYDNDNPNYINSVLGFKTTGATMADFPVTVVDQYGGKQTAIFTVWPEGGSKCGRAIIDGKWSLSQCGDTWRKFWTLEVWGTPIKSIRIEPITDDDGDDIATVFDTVTGLPQTDGSSNGRAITNIDHIDHSGGSITATYSQPALRGGTAPVPQDLYGVLTLTFYGLENNLSGTLTFRADTDNVELPIKGCCCLDFDLEDFYGYPGEFPLYLNNDGSDTHYMPENVAPEDKGRLDRFLLCSERRYPTERACHSALGEIKKIPFPSPDGQRAEVHSAHWFVNTDKSKLWCGELKDDLSIPTEVVLLAKGVKLKAKNKDGGVNLTLTTDSEKGTAAFTILRGDKLDNGGTAIKTVPTCSFPSGGSPYTCTDTVAGDNYRVLETEDRGSSIVYDPVTVK